jgi:hypothetical protein
MPRQKKDSGPPPLESLPINLRKAVVGVMVKYDLDIDEAYEKIAVLADRNSPLYDKDVEKSAERKYKSRYLKGMNAARATINRTANTRLDDKYSEGYEAGYAKGKNDNAIYFYCFNCKKIIYIHPNSNAHQAVVNYMNQNRWGHTECINKTR